MDWSKSVRMRRDADPILIHIYSEVLQKFRLAAQGKRPGKQPPEHLRSRIETYFDPLPLSTNRWRCRSPTAPPTR